MSAPRETSGSPLEPTPDEHAHDAQQTLSGSTDLDERNPAGPARWLFPRWTNRLVVVLLAAVGLTLLYSVGVAYFATEPRNVNVGYSPRQPVPFSHKTHAGQLKLDCRYCHNTVEQGAHAAIPPTRTCGNCHSGKQSDGGGPYAAVGADRKKLAPSRESAATGKCCGSCHGRVGRMEQVYQAEPLSMAWCLDCHRNPTPHLRPLDAITQMDWVPERDPTEVGREVHQQLNIKTSTKCSTCHR